MVDPVKFNWYNIILYMVYGVYTHTIQLGQNICILLQPIYYHRINILHIQLVYIVYGIVRLMHLMPVLRHTCWPTLLDSCGHTTVACYSS